MATGGGVEPVDRYRRSATEAGMQRTVKEAIEHRGGRVWHVRDSQGMDVGDMPDLLIVDPMSATVYLAEMKSQSRRVTDGQRHALDLLGACRGLWAGIVRPRPRDVRETSYDAFIDLFRGSE